MWQDELHSPVSIVHYYGLVCDSINANTPPNPLSWTFGGGGLFLQSVLNIFLRGGLFGNVSNWSMQECKRGCTNTGVREHRTIWYIRLTYWTQDLLRNPNWPLLSSRAVTEVLKTTSSSCSRKHGQAEQAAFTSSRGHISDKNARQKNVLQNLGNSSAYWQSERSLPQLCPEAIPRDITTADVTVETVF